MNHRSPALLPAHICRQVGRLSVGSFISASDAPIAQIINKAGKLKIAARRKAVGQFHFSGLGEGKDIGRVNSIACFLSVCLTE